MNLQYRIELLARLGEYILNNEESWVEVKKKAGIENGWFTPEFVDIATGNIARRYLQKEALTDWAVQYQLPEENSDPRLVGIIMAGNIPLVGFHDWLAVFIAGHKALIKPSSKDQVLLKHLLEVLGDWEPDMHTQTAFADMLKGCDAYFATGSNNSSRYFDYYFSKYPHIIRRNRSSVAVLTGQETEEELKALADDIHLFFGMGCRNVTKLYVPRNYDFVPLIDILKKYSYLADHHKYKNNFDYNLAIHILNNRYYMSSGALLLIEDAAIFSPISQLNYEYYDSLPVLRADEESGIQCIAGHGYIPFGKVQQPALTDYADGADTLAFLSRL
ncbi:MAG: acyl-CoA reductase [Bacteroidetes bacterium]|nr:acyl-CoA reductase [Bacteroidota bacterium]